MRYVESKDWGASRGAPLGGVHAVLGAKILCALPEGRVLLRRAFGGWIVSNASNSSLRIVGARSCAYARSVIVVLEWPRSLLTVSRRRPPFDEVAAEGASERVRADGGTVLA